MATAGSADIVVVLVAEAKLWERGLRSGCSWLDGPGRVVDNEREEIWLPVGCHVLLQTDHRLEAGMGDLVCC